jgi:hypothetical protein
VFGRNQVYARVTGWESFEPWLTRVEEFAAEGLWEIAEAVPPDWYGGDGSTIERLMETMLARRSRVRELIGAFRDSNREPFPHWGIKRSVVVPRSFEMPLNAGKFVM